MLIRELAVFTGIMLSTSVQAFPCFFTLAKDNCWTNYTVQVTVTDAVTNQQLTQVTVSAGQNWARQAFACQPLQKLKYLATFSPTIWEKDAGKVYAALQYWSLPAAPQAAETAWNIPVCYASDFSEVPLPPSATGQCQCNFQVIPPVPPQ